MTGNNGSSQAVEAPQGLAGLLTIDTLGVAGGQYQGLEFRLDVFDETIFMTRYEAGSPALVYEVSPLDLAAAFAGVEVATPVLPRRCLFWSRQGSVERLGIYLSPQTRGLWLAGRKRRAHVPLPGLILVGKGHAYRLWAVEHPRNRGEYARDWQPCETDRLYHAPLPNVNPKGNDAGVCQGTASREFPEASTAAIYRAVAALFDSEWNDHWIDGKSQAEPKDVRAMYPKVRRLGYWPAEDLVATSLTLGKVVT